MNKRMKLYIAGKTQDWKKVREIQVAARDRGHTITHDWTAVIEKHGGDSNEVSLSKETRMQYAVNDVLGVYYSDAVIAVGHPKVTGTLWECGMAVAFGKQLLLYKWGDVRRSIFEDLPNVSYLCHRFALMDFLEGNKVIPPSTDASSTIAQVMQSAAPPSDFNRLMAYYQERELRA